MIKVIYEIYPYILSVLYCLSSILSIFTCVFYFVDDVQLEGSKNEQSKTKKSQKRQFWAKQESMSRYGFIMPQHEVNSVKNQRSACRSMPRRFKDRILKTCRSMPKPCHGMATFIILVYFWQVGFWTPIVILLSDSYKKEVVGTFYLLRNLAIFIFFEFIKTFEKDCSQKLRKLKMKY